MNTKLINWSAQLQTTLFKDGWSHGLVQVKDNTVEISVSGILMATVDAQGVKVNPGGTWYHLDTEKYYLCERFRNFLKANPFPTI